MWDVGCRLPTQTADGRSRCFCGAEIDVTDTSGHIYTAHIAARNSSPIAPLPIPRLPREN
jgi:hypothetical protein